MMDISIPIGSRYAIYGNIYHQYTPNVSIYTIHGSYGIYFPWISRIFLILFVYPGSSSPSVPLGHFVAWHLEPQHLETRRLAVDIRSYGDIYQQNLATSSNNQQHIQHELGMNLVKNMGKHGKHMEKWWTTWENMGGNLVPHIHPAPDWLETRGRGAPVMNAVLRRLGSVRGDPTKGEEIATHLAPSCHWKFPGNLVANLKMVYQDVSNEVWQLYEAHPLSFRPELLSPPCCCQRHSTWKWWVLGVAGCPKPLAWDELGPHPQLYGLFKVRLNMGRPPNGLYKFNKQGNSWKFGIFRDVFFSPVDICFLRSRPHLRRRDPMKTPSLWPAQTSSSIWRTWPGAQVLG